MRKDKRETPMKIINRFIELYKSGMSVCEISDQENYNNKRIYVILARYGYYHLKDIFSIDDENEIIRLYKEDNVSIMKLQEKFPCSDTSIIRQILLIRAVKLKPQPMDDEELKKIKRLWEEGESNEVMLKEFFIDPKIVNQWSAEAEYVPVLIKPKVKATVYINKSDPLFCMAPLKRRTSLARYIMAQHLGRPLRPEEMVKCLGNDYTDVKNFRIIIRKK